jgi:hypothetical protein
VRFLRACVNLKKHPTLILCIFAIFFFFILVWSKELSTENATISLMDLLPN